ncbi:MAG TPA: hypothetical protein VF552_03600 [Allosphingosinicella sp.]
MKVDPDELRAELARLAGLPVSRQTFAGNSMLLWLGPHPRSADAIGLFIHPVWQLVLHGGGIVSSDECPMPDPDPSPEYDRHVRSFWDRAGRLAGLRVQRAALLMPGLRLLIAFEGGATLEQWPPEPDGDVADDANDGTEDWNLRLYASDMRYTIGAGGIVRGSVEHG